MAGRLTQRVVEAAKAPQKGQILVRDGRLSITSNGCKTFVWDGRIRRQMRRITIGRYPDLSLNEARSESLRIRHDIAIGLDPAQQRQDQREELTVGKLAVLYLDNHARQHKRSWLQDESRIRLHFRSITNLKLSAVSPDTVARWHQRIGNERGKFQANRCHALLSAMFGYAIRFGQWHGDNPAKGLYHYHEAKRERFLNAEELKRLWIVLDSEPSPYWRAYFRLALIFGMRKSELLRARWADVNLAEGIWKLPTTKNNRPHTLPIPTPAMEILEGLPSRSFSGWLFPSAKHQGQRLNGVDHAWQRIRSLAGIPDVRIHDLRRTFGSWLAAQGHSLPLIGKALNHTHVATTQIYARLDLEPVRVALEQNAALMLKTHQT